MPKFKELLFDFLYFIRNPNRPVYPDINSKQKLINVCLYFLSIHFAVSGIILWYPVAIAEKIGLFNPLSSASKDIDVLLTILSAIIIAPLIEEAVFRFPLGHYRNESHFRWSYYGTSAFFGLIHIFTYDIDSTHLPYAPFITMTQIFSGFMFGYIRVIYGFWYGVLLHALFNALGIIWQYTIGFSL